MDKIKEFFGKLWASFKSMGRVAKISIIVSAIAILLAIIIFGVYSVKGRYKVLFTGLDPKDAKVVTEKLKESKVSMKIEGDTILVLKEKVDELRLELAPQISNGSVGYELMDQGGSFGITDEEFQIKKLRMIQGELEKTIKTFPQIENARVHITLPKESVFVKESEPGKAVAYIQLKAGESLKPEQVKSIVALVSGAVPNLPRDNVEVIDQNMQLLSEGIIDENGSGAAGSASVENQKTLEENYEKKLEDGVYEILNPVIGKGKIKTQINVQMDFDSKQKTEVMVDPNKVIKNQETLREKNGISGDSTTSNPVDDNMSNTIDENAVEGSNNYKEQTKTEYDTGKTEVKTISAPGEVKRVTASVVIDGSLDPITTDAIKELVGTAIGFKQDRGDQISVMSMSFNQSENDEAKKQIEAMKAEEKKAMMQKTIFGIIVAAILLITIIAIIIFVKRRKDEEDDDEEEERVLDVLVSDENSQIANFEPINFEVKNEKVHVENEIKKYATDKPEQVTDVIKSWLNEDER